MNNSPTDIALMSEPEDIQDPLAEMPTDADAPTGNPDALPLYVQQHRARIGKLGDVLQITAAGSKDRILAEARIPQTSQVNIFGQVQISVQAVCALCSADVPICYFSSNGWFYGITHGLSTSGIQLRMLQFAQWSAPETPAALALARCVVAAKIRNQRTLLRRNLQGCEESALASIADLAAQATSATSLHELLGIEGAAAAAYFACWPILIKPRPDPAGKPSQFPFPGRVRRPPTDPINAMLSYGYAVLAKDCFVAAATVGFDPLLGFLHQPRPGRPALALDLMEEFRPLVIDSIVLALVNTGAVRREDFATTSHGTCLMRPKARCAILRAYERRLAQRGRHPFLPDVQLSYRQALRLQARQLARVLHGASDSYTPFETR